MPAWEYKVVPAPTKGVKAPGVKGPEERFAHTLEVLMNDMGAEGWEFQRAETLPSVERSGLTGTTTEWRNMMVFRRARAATNDEFEHELLPAPNPSVQTDPAPASTAITTVKKIKERIKDTVSVRPYAVDELEHERRSATRKAPAVTAVPTKGETKTRSPAVSAPKAKDNGLIPGTDVTQILPETAANKDDKTRNMPTSVKSSFVQSNEIKSTD